MIAVKVAEVSCLLYEIQASEIKKLPEGVQVLRYDTLYSQYDLLVAQEDFFVSDRRYYYFLFKDPNE